MALWLTLICGLILMLLASVGARKIWRARSHDLRSQRWLISLLPFCGAMVLLMTWIQIGRSPFEDWNAARTAPAVAWAKGMTLYYSRGVGPANDFVHGPVAAVVRLPAAIATTPTGAILIADAINAAIFYLPMIALLLVLRKRLLPTAIGALVFWGFSLCMESLKYSAFNVHADAPAVGFAMLALICVLVSAPRRWFVALLMLSAFCAVLSSGSKQNLAPVIVVLPLYVLIRHGWRWAVLLAASEIVLLGLFVTIAIHAFGWDAMIFQMITIPSRHPWFFMGLGRFTSLVLASGYLITDTIAPAAILGLLCLFFTRFPRRNWRSIRAWIVRNPWTLMLATAIFLIPSSLIGKAKIGGNMNACTPTSYFLVAALAAWIAGYRPRAPESWSSPASHLIVSGSSVLCIALSLAALNPWPNLLKNFQELAQLNHNPQQVAYEFSLQHPGTIYFPWNPLSTLMSEGKYYHFEYGLMDLVLAGENLSSDYLRAGVPANVQYLAYPPDPQSQEMRNIMTRFTVRQTIPELPGWSVYHRPQRSKT